MNDKHLENIFSVLVDISEELRLINSNLESISDNIEEQNEKK